MGWDVCGEKPSKAPMSYIFTNDRQRKVFSTVWPAKRDLLEGPLRQRRL